MRMWMMRGMVAQRFKNVLQIVGDEVKAHEEEEDRHGEACKNLSTLESKRMSNAGALPHFEIAKDVDHNANCGTYGIKEYQV